MKALDRLSQLLHSSLEVANRPIPVADNLESIIAALQRHNKTGGGNYVPEDLQQAAVRKFWESQRFETLKDARLVSFGMCVPIQHSGPCIMEDRQRFMAVLDANAGVDQWIDEPRWYRRCYQGLVRSYFMYDAKTNQASAVAKKNWDDLRSYLSKRTHNIVDKKVNPDWVTTARENRQLFSEDPCLPYAEQVLSEDTTKIDQLCEQLGIVKSSWFLRDLVLAQVRQATTYGHEQFKKLIPRLLGLLANNQVLRDSGFVLMLDKYVSASQPGINEPLRNASVNWWGNPWLPSNETRWGAVTPAAREMVSDWLKREFVEAFFTKLAEDGVGDRRRANFWLRYVKSMGNIRFALGARALYSRDSDFDALRKKMKGLYTELRATGSANNAFIMTLGDLVAVEFGDGGALYGYSVSKKLPFDYSKPLETAVNARNSLKNSTNIIKLTHHDGIHGWHRWEEMFEATLVKAFDIHPDVTVKRVAPRDALPQTIRSADSRGDVSDGTRHTRVDTGFSLAALYAYAEAKKIKVEDKRALGGSLWVRKDDTNHEVNKVLMDWKFKYKPGKGWWR